MSKPRPLPTMWEELTMPQRHLMRVLATMEYDQDDAHDLAKVAWPEKDHTRIHYLSKRYATEWGMSQQLRYLRGYNFVEHTGPIVLSELGRKVYAERWDREIGRLLDLRDFLDERWGYGLMDHEGEWADDKKLTAAFTEWLDKDEQARYVTREWEKMAAWKTESTRFSSSIP